MTSTNQAAEPWPDYYTLFDSWNLSLLHEGEESEINPFIDAARDMVAMGHEVDVVANLAGELYARLIKGELREWFSGLEAGDSSALQSRAEHARGRLEGSLLRFRDAASGTG